MSTPTIASWLLTYLLHSTVLLALAVVTSRLLGEKHLALQETFLRAALIGGILTASLQVGLGIRPAVGVFHIAGVDGLQGVVHSTLDPAVTATQGTTAPAGLSETVFGSLKHLEGSWAVWLLSIWGVGMLVSVLKLGRSALDLRRLLTTRRLRPADRLFARLTRLMGFRRSVLFSTSRAIAMPFATGIRRPEVCCPERVDDLAIEHQEGLYAHELAHLARRDPSWQMLYRLGEALLCLQPLNRIVRRRLEEIAEHLTDDRAVACTGDRLGLARCLVVMAHWGAGSEPGLPAAAFASGPRLDRRIGRLLEHRSTTNSHSIWAVPLAACLLMAGTLTFPVVGSRPANADTISDVPNSASAKTWSDADEAPAKPPTPPQTAPLPSLPVAEAVTAPESPTSKLPAVPIAPEPSVALPHPAAAPAPAVAPAPSVALPHPAVAPVPVVAPEPETAPVAEAPPPPQAVPAPPVSAQPPSPEEPPLPPAPEENATSQSERSREEARSQQLKAQRERAEAEARARERERTVEKESRAVAAEARQASREAAEDRERIFVERRQIREQVRVLVEKARSEARAISFLASEQAREQAERTRELARETAELARLSDADRAELRRRIEAQRAAQRDQARESAERARRLAEEAEAERNAAKEHSQKNGE